MEKTLKFPPDFLWGTATAAYQVEGGINNCDWSKIYPAGRACDHYNLYEQDFDLIEELGNNAYRFSIEWSRIEPEKGNFDKQEIDHYRKVLSALKKRNVKSFVTLWHFSTPDWLAKESGWANPGAIRYFERYVKVVVEELGDLADFWITLNEPDFIVSLGYVKGIWPPRSHNILLAPRVYRNLVEAHKRAYEIIHKTKKNARVGIAMNCTYSEPHNHKSPLDRFSASLWEYVDNHLFLDLIKDYHDYIGLNYYFHDRLKFPFLRRNEDKTISDLGWEIYPKGIFHALKEIYGRYKKPIYITENGIADKDDKSRNAYIKDHLFWIHRAIGEKVEVDGYLHWSLMDNFEWEKGFSPCFGLIEVDRNNLKRKLRPSAYAYAEICKNNQLIIDN